MPNYLVEYWVKSALYVPGLGSTGSDRQAFVFLEKSSLPRALEVALDRLPFVGLTNLFFPAEPIGVASTGPQVARLAFDVLLFVDERDR